MRNIEVVIVGAGPGGLGAALAASSAGAEVVLIDEYPTLGGHYYKRVPEAFRLKALRAEGEEYAEGLELVNQIKAAKIEVMSSTLVWSVYRNGVVGVYRGNQTEEVKAQRIILAPGAQEAPVAFPGWTLPGVMMGGAAQALMVTQRVLPGRRAVLAGVGPLQLKVASQLTAAGATVLGILEASSTPPVSMENALQSFGHWAKMRQGLKYWLALKKARIPYLHSHVPVRALGRDRLEAVVIAEVDTDWKVRPGTERTLEADLLCLSYGFVPAGQLPRMLACRQEYHASAGGWVTWHDPNQATSTPGIYVAGEVGGIGGAEVALEEGRIAGWAAARSLGKGPSGRSEEAGCRKRLGHAREFAKVTAGMMQLKPGIAELITPDTILCRCENVTAQQVTAALDADPDFTVRGVKIHTRAGMGPCQGRICSHLIARLIAGRTGRPLDSVPADTPQVPIKPVPLRALLGRT